MAAVVWLLPPVLLGCLLALRFGGIADLKPRWAAWLIVLGAGIAGGAGITSCLFFLTRLLLPSVPALPVVMELAALMAAAYAVQRGRRAGKTQTSIPRPPWTIALAAALALMILIVTLAISNAWEANPHGYWDALSVWNLRARFLAADAALAQRAWTRGVPIMHMEYPLLTGAFIARCWAYGGTFTPAVPQLTSYLFLLALISLGAGAVVVLRGPTLGLLCGLALAATPRLLHEVPAQYADVPLACYFAGAILLALLDRPLMAGGFAGFAAWTKDEGLLFLGICLAASIAFRRRAALRLAAGALPGLAITLAFKMWVAPADESLVGRSAAGFAQKIADPSRYVMVARAFAEQFAGLGAGWYHPILPLLALWIALRFDRDRRRDLFYCATICGALVAGYFAVYIVSPYDLKWHLQTSVERLWVQIWPSLTICAFLPLCTPKVSVLSLPTPKKKERRTVRGARVS
jgi:hypothetical protein